MNKEANKYVNCVKFSPNGETYVTADSGGKAFVYDGKEGKFMHELNGGEASAHNAGIYGLSWSGYFLYTFEQSITWSSARTRYLRRQAFEVRDSRL